MDKDMTQEFAGKQLDRVLAFFPRVETKASFLFALDTGLLAILVLNLEIADFLKWYLALPAALTVGLVSGSLYFVYRCHFPELKGSASSLIYFRAIAARTEADFVEESLNQTGEKYTHDLLGQIWRNSEILTSKYTAVKVAFLLTILALIPWGVFLALVAIFHSSGFVIK